MDVTDLAFCRLVDLPDIRRDKLIAYYKKQIERLDPDLKIDGGEAA